MFIIFNEIDSVVWTIWWISQYNPESIKCSVNVQNLLLKVLIKDQTFKVYSQ